VTEHTWERSRAPLADFGDLLTPSDLAHVLKNSVKTLEKWRHAGNGPPWILLGRRIAYPRENVLIWMRSQETRGRNESAPMKTEQKEEVTAWPYTKDPSRFQVSMFFAHPINGQEIRKRSVAPADRRTLEAAIRWGHSERLRLVTALCQVPATAEERKEGEAETKKKNDSPTLPTLATFWETFTSGYMSKCKPGHRSNVCGEWRNHICPILGDVQIDQIDRAALTRLQRDLERKGLGPETVKKTLARVRVALEYARQIGVLPEMHVIPKIAVRVPKAPPMEVYTAGELEALRQVPCALEEHVLVLLLTDAVLRIGECAGLQWGDIDLERGVMKIARNVHQRVLQSTPKGEVGTLPLTPRLRQGLAELRAQGTGSIFLFIRLLRGSLTHKTDKCLQRVVYRLQRKAGLAPRGPHRIRHSVLTHLAEGGGVDPYALQALARHSELQTTMKYVSVR